MSFEKLFSPIKIRELELRNRVVMSAMGTHESAASEDGRMVTDKLIPLRFALWMPQAPLLASSPSPMIDIFPE